MHIVRRSAAGAALTALAIATVHAAPAAADGLPIPVEDSLSGVASPDGASRYLTVTLRGRTAVLAQRAKTGAVVSRLELPGRFGIPVVALDSTAGGVSADGRTLVLIRPRAGFPRRTTTLAVLSTTRWLRLRRTIELPGDFSYDALSPDGRSLFLVNYISPTDPTKYRVRVFDLQRNRLDPEAIVDPSEEPDEMNGFPLARVTSPDGRWAYTLYDGVGKHPFIHALDTRDRKAVCIDLEGPAFAAGTNPYDLRLASGAGGARLDVRRRGTLVATVQTATFRVLQGAQAAAAVAAAKTPRVDPAGPHLLWPAIGGLLLASLLVALRLRRRARAGRAMARPHAASAP